MQRNVRDLTGYGPIVDWCYRENRKPLLLLGGKQVGKTWLVKQFAERGPFSYVYYIDFLKEKNLKNLFTPDADIKKLTDCLVRFREKGPCPPLPKYWTLFIFDNIQECPDILLNLNSFYKEENYRVIAIGSSMHISHEIENRMEILKLYPFTFREFLQEFDKNLSNRFGYSTVEDKELRDQLLNAFRYYLAMGGMPGCINTWKETGSLETVRDVQNRLIQQYRQDLFDTDLLGKNAFALGRKSVSILDSIPEQLSKPNQSFMAKHVPVYAGQKTVGKRSILKKALNYLSENEIILPVFPEDNDPNALVPFLFDTGLLGALADIDIGEIVRGKDYPFKEVLLENFLVQELQSQSYRLYYRYDKHELHCRKDYIQNSGEGSESYRYVITESKISSRRIKRSKEKWIIFTENTYLKEDYCCYIPIYIASEFKEVKMK